MSLYVGDRQVYTCTLDGHRHRVTYTRCRINAIDCPYDEHRGAGNMQIIEINIYEKKNCESRWLFTTIEPRCTVNRT